MKASIQEIGCGTGYYGRPSEDGQSAKTTHVHVVRDGKPICGYKPHKTMIYQWCARGIFYEYVTCKKCIKVLKKDKNMPKLHCELPTEKDLDWMEKAVQRHTGGFKKWWEQNKDEMSGRDWMKLFIMVWESGRVEK